MVDEGQVILAVDTATPSSTVALTTGTRAEGRVLGELSVSSSVTHSRRLLVAIDQLLASCGIGREQISGYAVGLGPGSFTGLRIGLATVKGLAAAAGRPLYGVSTLDVLVANCHTERLICSVLDARKKEVYAAFYRCNAVGVAERVSDIDALSPQELAERIREPVLMIGDGLLAYGRYFQSVLGNFIHMAPANLWRPSAAALGLLAGGLQVENQALDTGSAVPYYVRASDAELNLKVPATGP